MRLILHQCQSDPSEHRPHQRRNQPVPRPAFHAAHPAISDYHGYSSSLGNRSEIRPHLALHHNAQLRMEPVDCPPHGPRVIPREEKDTMRPAEQLGSLSNPRVGCRADNNLELRQRLFQRCHQRADGIDLAHTHSVNPYTRLMRVTTPHQAKTFLPASAISSLSDDPIKQPWRQNQRQQYIHNVKQYGRHSSPSLYRKQLACVPGTDSTGM